jgi:predicted CXXCH cytochrome family protein
VRRLALLATGGALWLFLFVVPVFADGGPHVLTNNNGTAGLAGDCAACHRAHTAQAADLLKEELPGLCLSCHNGTGATADVVDGQQYVPDTDGTPTGTVLGALRGGGFDYALIGDPARLSYTSTRGVSQLGHVGVGAGDVTTSTHQGAGTVWGNGAVDSGAGPSTGIVLDCAKCHNPHGNGQYRILQTEPGEDWGGAYTVADADGVEVQEVAPLTLALTEVRNYTVRPSTNGLTTGIVGGATDGDYWRYKSVNSSGVAQTTGSPWSTSTLSADPMNRGWIDWTTSYVRGNGSSAGTTTYQFRYPINDGELAAYKAALTAAGRTTDPISGALIANTVLDNRGGLMTAWCTQCHTRYNAQRVLVPDPSVAYPSGQTTSPASLTDTLGDDIFTFRHGTTGVGCLQCHVQHGSNVVMLPGTASSDVAWPGEGFVPGTGNADSRLLKVNNRGTCQLCHDPTGTTVAGDYTGPVPTPGL